VSAAQPRWVPEIIAALATAVQTRQPVALTPTEAARLVGHVNRLTTLLSATLQGDDVSVDAARATLRDSIPTAGGEDAP